MARFLTSDNGNGKDLENPEWQEINQVVILQRKKIMRKHLGKEHAEKETR